MVQTKPCALQDPGKGAVTSTRDWARPAFEYLSVSCGGMSQQWPAAETGALAAAVLDWEVQCAGISTFEGGLHYCHCPHHSLASGQTTGREHSPAHQQKIGLKIYWAWPLKAISPEHSLEGLMLKLKLKLQYFGHLMRRTDLLEKTLTLGKIEGRRRRWRQRMRWLDGITN